ncbi:hypothetical protein BD779DRAFT_1788446 [Infundibulicybe gibba]|nr:hypothetical protein BD779DRAFT_1788446 [Infundibulicybe gibba]
MADLDNDITVDCLARTDTLAEKIMSGYLEVPCKQGDLAISGDIGSCNWRSRTPGDLDSEMLRLLLTASNKTGYSTLVAHFGYTAHLFEINLYELFQARNEYYVRSLRQVSPVGGDVTRRDSSRTSVLKISWLVWGDRADGNAPHRLIRNYGILFLLLGQGQESYNLYEKKQNSWLARCFEVAAVSRSDTSDGKANTIIVRGPLWNVWE